MSNFNLSSCKNGFTLDIISETANSYDSDRYVFVNIDDALEFIRNNSKETK